MPAGAAAACRSSLTAGSFWGPVPARLLKSFRAFSSVNYPDLAVVQDEHLLQYIRCESRPRPLFYDRLDPNVGLLKLIPGTEDALAGSCWTATTASSSRKLRRRRSAGIRRRTPLRRGTPWGGRGKLVVMTTQVPNEGSDLTVYHVGDT